MTSTIEATAEFTFEVRLGGFSIATFDCRATADVVPAVRGWGYDGGVRAAVGGFRDIEVEGVKYDIRLPEGQRSQRRWFKPHDTLRDWILAYLESGAADIEFEDEAEKYHTPTRRALA